MRNTITRALAALALLASALSARAEAPAARAARRQRVETQIAGLEEHLASLPNAARTGNPRIIIARQRLRLARTLLRFNDDEAARNVADSAGRLLAPRASRQGETR